MKTNRPLIFFSFALLLFCFAALLCCCAPAGQTEETPVPSPALASETTDCAHTYVFDRFEWTNDHHAYAVSVCSKNAEHIRKEEAQVEKKVLREATEELAGQAEFTARAGEHVETVTASYMASVVSLRVYAVNDYHGAVEKTSSQAGLETFATFFKEMGEDGNTLLIDSGDTWQGSIASNFSSGLLLSDIYNYIGIDAKTLGNHEFDWTADVIARNAAHESYGRKTPYLAANIYNYDVLSGKVGDVQQERLGKKSVIYQLDSGLTVGIVGVIDKSVITTINSMNVIDLSFTDHIAAIKKEARSLRAQGCDLVIASIHGDVGSVLGKRLQEDVDLVLCAHSHQRQEEYEGDLLFAQFGSRGEYFGEITIRYQPELRFKQTTVKTLSASEIDRRIDRVDPTVREILQKYESEFRAEADTVIASNVTGSFSASGALANLMCRAVFDKAHEEGYPVVLTYVNKARATLPYGTWTYEDLYAAFPFDDLVLISEVSGRDILREIARYNYIYRSPDFKEEIDPNKTYLVGVVDYLLLHCNEQRDFDYFPVTAGSFSAALRDNYRVILRDWLIENGYASGKKLDPAAYSSELFEHNRKELE